MNFEILIYNDIHPGKIRKPYEKTIDQLAGGDFSSAEVKKMTGTGLYRAKIDYENRLLFKFGRFENQYYLLILEIIFSHNYHKSRFLRGTEIIEEKLIPVKNGGEIPDEDVSNLFYINKRYRHFHLLDKVLSFDDDQDQILSLPLPQIIIGSAGSGKTALTLEKIKTLSGKVLYVTLSPHLAENSARLFYSNNYENDHFEVNFLSYREFIETLKIPDGKKMDFRTFENWFSRHQQSLKLRDAHKVFEEIRGVITGLDVTRGYMSRAEYLSQGIKQSLFLHNEREKVYLLFEKYLEFLNGNGYYDINIISWQWLPLCTKEYDFIVVDEVQDFTNIQLHLILKSLLNPNHFMLCGDSNQIVHPNFFSWSHLKSMFYQSDTKGSEIRILHANYRNSWKISEIANRLLKIKNARFGSIDHESNYLVKTVSKFQGEAVFIEDKGNASSDLSKKTSRSVNYAVIVLRNEDKPKVRDVFHTPLLFSVQESKGLEYENIIIYNLISDNAAEFMAISEGVSDADLLKDELVYSRNRDKSDKSAEVYKFYINSLYVSITRAVKNVYIIEKSRNHPLCRLLGIAGNSDGKTIKEEISSADDWKIEARKLEKQGKNEQAEAIIRNILSTVKTDWEPLTAPLYQKLKAEALDPENFNKKAKDRLFDMALVHDQSFIMEKLAELKYKRAENYQAERGSLFRRYYRNYRDDNWKMAITDINRYGVNFRDHFNFTPLHAAVFSGALNITAKLLENGANPDLLDTFNKTPLQIALGQAFVHSDYARTKLGKIYPLLLSDSLKIQVEDKLIKIDPHKFEFFLINLFIAVETVILQKKKYFLVMGINMQDIIEKIEEFSEAVLPDYRKRKEYILGMLSKNEVNSNNIYNKKLFIRIEKGHYRLNPALRIWCNNAWITTEEIFSSNAVTVKEIKNLHFEKHIKEVQKQIAKEELERQKRDQFRFRR